MLVSLNNVARLAKSVLLIHLIITVGWSTLAQAKNIDGVGKLKFGMKPSDVEALEGCSSNTECLYENLKKNRYFKLIYGPNGSTNNTESSTTPTGTLTHIDIDMGNHTSEWFGELYEILVAQYPISHIPTEQEDLQFRDGINNELIIGFAEGSVLLKLVRRPFGNLILKVVYQDHVAAQAQRQRWGQTSPK